MKMTTTMEYYFTLLLVLFITIIPNGLAQSNPTVTGWKTSNYPDPRVDFAKCGGKSPGLVCDPDGLLTDQQRIALKMHIAHVGQQSRKVINKSTFCKSGAPDGLLFFIVLMNKVDNGGAVVSLADIKGFAYEIKGRYNIVNDVSDCDTTMVIACSMKDGQLYTVAGRDTQLTGDTLNEAFRHNRYHFTAGNVLGGLVDLISELGNDYGVAHGIPNLTSEGQNTNSNASIEVDSTAAPVTNNNTSAVDDASGTIPSNPLPDQVKRASPSGDDGSSITEEGSLTSSSTVASATEEQKTNLDSLASLQDDLPKA